MSRDERQDKQPPQSGARSRYARKFRDASLRSLGLLVAKSGSEEVPHNKRHMAGSQMTILKAGQMISGGT